MKKLTVDEIKKIYNENSFVKCRKYYDIEFWCIIPLVIIKDGIKTTVHRWGINKENELVMEDGKFKGKFISLEKYKVNESIYKIIA
jgi:hypothetical protein